MPNFPWLAKAKLDPAHVAADMRGMRAVGVPYTQEDIASAADVGKYTELQAVVAYLQVLGTEVKFEQGVNYRE
jgi:cytochrome c oxidase cbb3-type subunit 2